MLIFSFGLLLSCSTPEEPETGTPHEALIQAVDACAEDEACLAQMEECTDLLGNCPWYSAIGCSAAVAAAGAACVVTEGEACVEALELVAEIGCCDCLPKGKVQDLCKEI